MSLLVGVDEEEGVAVVDEGGAGGAVGHAGVLTVFGYQKAVHHPMTPVAREPPSTSSTRVSSVARWTCTPTPTTITAHPAVQQEVRSGDKVFLMEASNPDSFPAEYNHPSLILYLTFSHEHHIYTHAHTHTTHTQNTHTCTRARTDTNTHLHLRVDPFLLSHQ